ncbi:MAG: ferredoxin--NADP reductase [Gammaproteobacteria bacterium]|jgi:ferredoxin--NADP+ reductase
MSRWVEGRVIGLRQWTDELYSILVEADIAPFVPGQFTRLALEIDGEMVARPYSFVNGPDDPVCEFYFIIVPEGPLSHHLIRLEPGDTVFVAARAAGFLILSELPDADHLWLLSSGTGIGPFLSILNDGEVWRRFDRIVLVHAVRREVELTHRETIEKLLVQHPEQLQYVPFVSREKTGFALHGRVPAAIEDGRLEARTGLTIDAQTSQVMICGNPYMVHDTQAVLEARGLKRNRRREPGQITVEQYWKESD